MSSLRILLSSAESGDAGSQCDLAMKYAIGDEVAKDTRKAAFWWRKAAEQENAPSQFNLANLYYRGDGVERDYSQAFSWYRKAAEHGHLGFVIQFSERHTPRETNAGIIAAVNAAFINLGRCFSKGHGVAKDDVEAYAYYNLGGITSEIGRDNIATLERRMTREEIAEGQRRTRQLKEYYCRIGL
jgi:TPR repeat protein